MTGMFVRIDQKYLPDTVIVVPLLQELFLVGCWIPLDEVLQLRQVRCEEDSSSHCKEVDVEEELQKLGGAIIAELKKLGR